VVEDDNGNIWLTTWDKGVYKYDGKYFTNYTVREGVKDVNFVSMYKDRRGGLWVGTNENGVYKYNGKDFERFER
jgi:ligand-binding sensor domain-containing protein